MVRTGSLVVCNKRLIIADIPCSQVSRCQDIFGRLAKPASPWLLRHTVRLSGVPFGRWRGHVPNTGEAVTVVSYLASCQAVTCCWVQISETWGALRCREDSTGATIDFLLSAKRDAAAAERFLAKAL